jgi:addiction module HigA family antidote
MPQKLPPIYPGEILLTEFLEPLNLSQNQLALDLRVPATRIHDIIHGKRGITAETALRLGRYFGTSTEFWINLQSHYDIEVAQDQSGAQIEREVQPRELSHT